MLLKNKILSITLAIALLLPTVSFASTQITKSIPIIGEITNRTADMVDKILASTTPGEYVYVYIDSPGGLVSAGNRIIKAIQDAGVVTVAVVNGFVASMAVDVLISCKYVKINYLSSILFHSSFQVHDNRIVRDFVGLTIPHALQANRYKDYLTTAQMYSVFILQQDLWLNEDQLTRLINEQSTPLEMYHE